MTTPFDQLLRESLKPPPQAPGRCLDAETLAAWSEGTLDAAERAEVEAHASNCGRCQALLAAMVRIEPVAAVRPWWRSPAFGWLAPLTVAGAALAIWVRMGLPPSTQQVAMAPAVATQAPAGPSAQSLPAKPPPQELRVPAVALPKPVAGSDQAAVGRAVAEEAREILRDRALDTSERARQAERIEVASEPAAQRPSAVVAVPPAGVTMPPAAPPAPAREPSNAVVDTLTPLAASPASSKQANATKPAAAPPAAAPAPAATAAPTPPPIPPVAPTTRTALSESPGAGAVGSRVASFSADQREVTVQTADGVTRWRVTSPGTVQRSTDAGVRWDTQPSGERAVVFAGAAPSSTVCWLVGRGGVVLLTTDGRSWRKVPFPRAIDLVAVTAADERTATVTAADGRRFTTTDGGVNWK